MYIKQGDKKVLKLQCWSVLVFVVKTGELTLATNGFSSKKAAEKWWEKNKSGFYEGRDARFVLVDYEGA